MPRPTYRGAVRRRMLKKSKDKKQDKRLAKIETHISAAELKYIGGYNASAPGAVAGQSYYMYQLAQGNNVTDRKGDSIKPMITKFSWWFQNSDIANYYFARLLLVRINNTAGTVVNSNMFDIVTANTQTQAQFNPVYTHITGIRDKFVKTGVEYEILYDTGPISVAPFVANTGGARNFIQIKKTFKYNKRKPVRFNGTAAINVTAGSLVVLTYVQNTAVNNGGAFTSYFLDD